MKAKEVAIYAGLALAGIAAYTAFVKISKLTKAGATLGTAAVAAATEIVTKDLNPASDQNIVYRAAGAATQAATGNPNESLGGWMHDFWASISSSNAFSSWGTPADTPQQSFRESEIEAQNKAAIAEYERLMAEQRKMSDSRTEFRLLELQDQKVSLGEIKTNTAFGIYPNAF